MHPHFPRNMGKNLVTIFQFYPKHRIGERFDNRTHYLDRLFFRHMLFPECVLKIGSEVPYAPRMLLTGPILMELTQDVRPVFGDGDRVLEMGR